MGKRWHPLVSGQFGHSTFAFLADCRASPLPPREAGSSSVSLWEFYAAGEKTVWNRYGLIASLFTTQPSEWAIHARCHFDCRCHGRFSAHGRLRPAVRAALTMSIDYILGGIVSIGVLIYLVFALVRPERF